MALISCPECRQPVSDQAPACPHCGYVINHGNDPVVRSMNNWRLARFLVSFLFFVAIAVIILVMSSGPR